MPVCNSSRAARVPDLLSAAFSSATFRASRDSKILSRSCFEAGSVPLRLRMECDGAASPIRWMPHEISVACVAVSLRCDWRPARARTAHHPRNASRLRHSPSVGLHSGDPRLIAWAADFARRNHDQKIIGEMPALLEHCPFRWAYGGHKSQSVAAVTAVLDMLRSKTIHK
jgi:hypothetical protein